MNPRKFCNHRVIARAAFAVEIEKRHFAKRLGDADTPLKGEVIPFCGDKIFGADAHVRACLRAIEDGAPSKGYIAWSLMDNYEWAFGYEKRFGLVHVDFNSLQRQPKASYHTLAQGWRAG